MIVRPATGHDVPALLALAEAMHAESAYRWLPWDGEQVAARMAAWIDDRGVLLLVAERDGTVIGALLGGLGGYWFCMERQAVCQVLFVAPEHRGTRAALVLLRTFMAWARRQGAVEATVSETTGVKADGFGALMAREGLAPAGTIYKARIMR